MLLDGPSVSVTVTCSDCYHKRSKYYCVEDGNDVDSGFDYSCAHPNGKGAMGDTTPAWCPVLGEKMSDDATMNAANRLLRVASITGIEPFTTDAALVVMSIKAKAKEIEEARADATRREDAKWRGPYLARVDELTTARAKVNDLTAKLADAQAVAEMRADIATKERRATKEPAR